ncbi:hypothetical protein SDJN03_27375, partial [Cucurbita argyrosperma subsp. sororia]
MEHAPGTSGAMERKSLLESKHRLWVGFIRDMGRVPTGLISSFGPKALVGGLVSTSRSILDTWTSSPQLDSLEVSRSLLPFLSDMLDYGHHSSTVHSHNNIASPHRVFRLDTLTNRKDFRRLTIFLYEMSCCIMMKSFLMHNPYDVINDECMEA